MAGLILLAAATCFGDDAKPLTVSRLTPAGAAAGTTTKITATGDFPAWPAVEAWSDRGQVLWKPLDEPGTFEVTVPAEGSLGLHRVRFHDATGTTAVKPFLVGNVPEQAEAEPNDTLDKASPIDVMPVTINGLLEKSGDVDGYRVELQAGETLVAALEAHTTLGSPVDAVLELVDAGGAYLARNLDAVGLDPRLSYTAQRDAVCVLRVYGFPSDPNSTIGLTGGADNLYRLTLTTGSFAAGTLPAVASATAATELRVTGWNLAEDLAAASLPATENRSTWVGFPGVAGVVSLPVVDTASLPVARGDRWEAEPLSPPFVASGRFDAAAEQHQFRFTAARDQKLQLRLESQKAGFEADPLLVLADAAGTPLLSPSERDASASWSAPADGSYTLDIRDRRGRFGPAHLYRLTVEPETPAVTARVAADQFTVKAGEPLAIDITLDRRFGFGDAVEFVLAEAPAGVTAEPATSTSEGDAAAKVTLTMSATMPMRGPLRIIGRPPSSETADETPQASVAVLFGDGLQEAWLTVLEAPPATDVGGTP
jgi:hypothetical protein